MYAGHEQYWYMDVMLIGIIVGYVVIAWHFFTRLKTTKTPEAKTALGLLTGITVFSALAGYLPRLIYMSKAVILVPHVLLVIFTWLYIIFGKTDRLVLAVDQEHVDEESKYSS